MITTECGIYCVISYNNIAIDYIIPNMKKLQHRGRDCYGIYGIIDGEPSITYGDGLVDYTGSDKTSKFWLGHLMYSTSRKSDGTSVMQPINTGEYVMAFNGNIPDRVWEKCGIHGDDTDTTKMIRYINTALDSEFDMIATIHLVLANIDGAYSMVIRTPHAVYAMRDKYGIRPLCINKGKDIEIASESVALTCTDNIMELSAGQIAIISNNKITIDSTNSDSRRCVFEYLYFMTTNTVADKISVSEFRRKIIDQFQDKVNVDKDEAIICGVPSTGILYGTTLSEITGIEYTQILSKNPSYKGRTFILPDDKARQKACREKYICTKTDKSTIIIVDDSIVRGNSMDHISKLIRKHNPDIKLIIISASPPIAHPCSYGVDFADIEDLIINKMSLSDMEKRYHARIIYLGVEELKKVMDQYDGGFCDACFTGNYMF